MGATFVLGVAPRYHHWNPEECPRNWEAYAYSNHEPYQFEYFRFFEEQRQRVDYPVVNLLSAFKKAEEFPLVYTTDPHWNARGHAMVAKALAEFPLQHGMEQPATSQALDKPDS